MKQKNSATSLGFDEAKLFEAIEFSKKNESKMDRDIEKALREGHFHEPWPISKTIGPVKKRKGNSGAILRGNEIVQVWGDVEYVDMAFSMSKSFLSLCAGIAFKENIISDFHAPIIDTIQTKIFETTHNKKITWSQMLQLTSEWEGELWGKPDWIDHNRNLDDPQKNRLEKGKKRKLNPPGTFWEYNDVRVNVLSYALMLAFERSLPDVLREHIMVPIGASNTWEWHGYKNSWDEVNGTRLQSVSGGAHWGGGLWISTLDLARIGQLMINKGVWDGKVVIPKKWVKMSTKPCDLALNYGYLWWLNDKKTGMFPGAPTTAFAAMGVGTQILYIDPKNDLVIVNRWIEEDKAAKFVRLILDSIVF
jgi:CubicO group peptidase (beta-lactamase class C family)